MSEVQTQGIPNNPQYGVAPTLPTQTALVDGAITLLAGGVVELTKATAGAFTLANPAGDGHVLYISAKTAAAHVITIADGLHGLGTGEDVATFGGAIDDCLILASNGGYWMQVSNINVTVA